MLEFRNFEDIPFAVMPKNIDGIIGESNSLDNGGTTICFGGMKFTVRQSYNEVMTKINGWSKLKYDESRSNG